MLASYPQTADSFRFRPHHPALVWTYAAHLDWFGRSVSVGDDGLTIGRLGADLDVDDRGVSRVHARISRSAGGRWILTDLGSTNGTLLNGIRVHSVELSDGDEIRIGAVTALRFSTDPEAHRAPALAA